MTCFGFGGAREHAQQRAQRLDHPDLMPAADDADSLTGYEKYNSAVHVESGSAQDNGTYIDRGTDPRLA